MGVVEAMVMNDFQKKERAKGGALDITSLKERKESGREPRVLEMKRGENGRQSQMPQRSQMRQGRSQTAAGQFQKLRLRRVRKNRSSKGAPCQRRFLSKTVVQISMLRGRDGGGGEVEASGKREKMSDGARPKGR